MVQLFFSIGSDRDKIKLLYLSPSYINLNQVLSYAIFNVM